VTPTETVLVVEDEPQMRKFLRALVSGHGYRVIEAETAALGLTAAATHAPDVILLDLALPDMDGLELTERLREWSSTPIIVISARGLEADKVRALDLGADDYLTKPFGSAELLARLRAALRRAQRVGQGASATFVLDGLEVDLAARRVVRDGEEIHLTPIEFKLLALMVRHAGKVLTHRQILRDVWGAAYVEHPHYVRVFMAQLRRKLEPDPARPRWLLTETGVGYRMRAPTGAGS
jgi:two-component system KDP operon response regulator KdpE